VNARVLRFPRPMGEEVETAWATHRALLRAEIHDQSLLNDPSHVRARDKAEREFERLYAEWCKS
jgi:hypothetical protein